MSQMGEASQAVRLPAPRRVLLVAGEASGDLHGADLLRALRQRAPEVEVSGLGGEHLRAAGMRTVADAREVATVGVVEGIGRLRALVRVYRALTRILRREKPDLCVASACRSSITSAPRSGRGVAGGCARSRDW
jgi:hypothetical protein